MTVTASNLPILLAIMFVGRTSAMVVGLLVGLWGCWREKRSRDRRLQYGELRRFLCFSAARRSWRCESTLGFSLHSVSLAASWMRRRRRARLPCQRTWRFSAWPRRLKYDHSIRSFWREELGPFLQSLAILTALGVAVAGLYAEAGIADRRPSVHPAPGKPVHVQAPGA